MRLRALIAAAAAACIALAVLTAPSSAAGDATAKAASLLSAPAAGAAGAGIAKPPTKWDPISYGKSRKRQMANYSKRHYGKRTWKLRKPRALVLHYTAGSTYASAWSTFDANTPSLGESPGVCAQFIVDRDGTIYQLTRLGVRCRHTIGLNHVSLGIEMVQPDLGNPHRTAQAILDRKRQARSAVRLAAWIKSRYGIRMSNVIGHGMANDSPLFEDKQGWRNDHTDWLPPEVRTFRKRISKALHGG
jgi:hypothetical protein